MHEALQCHHDQTAFFVNPFKSKLTKDIEYINSKLDKCVVSLGGTKATANEFKTECKGEKNLYGYCLINKVRDKYHAKLDQENAPNHYLKCHKFFNKASNELDTKSISDSAERTARAAGKSECRLKALDEMKSPSRGGLKSAAIAKCLKPGRWEKRSSACLQLMRDRLHYASTYISKAYKCEKGIPHKSSFVSCYAPSRRDVIANFI